MIISIISIFIGTVFIKTITIMIIMMTMMITIVVTFSLSSYLPAWRRSSTARAPSCSTALTSSSVTLPTAGSAEPSLSLLPVPGTRPRPHVSLQLFRRLPWDACKLLEFFDTHSLSPRSCEGGRGSLFASSQPDPLLGESCFIPRGQLRLALAGLGLEA